MKSIALTCLLGLGSLAWVSAASGAEPLTLSRLWVLALEANPDLLAANRSVAAARQATEKARLDRGPEATLTSRYTRLSEGMRVDIPAGVIDENPRSFTVDSLNMFGATLSLSQSVYTGGALTARIKMAEAELRESGSHLERARQDILLEVTRAFFGFLKARDRVVLFEEAAKQARAHAETARGFLESGLVTRLDVLEAEVRQAEVERGRFNAVSSVELNRMALNTLLGRPLDASLEIAPEARFEAAAPPAVECRRRALEHRPELAILHARLEGSDGAVALARSRSLPSVSVTGAYQMGNSGELSGGWGNHWSAGALVTWNLWDYGRRNSDLEQARASREEIQWRKRSAEAGIALEVEKAYQKVRETEAALVSLDPTRAKVAETLQLARERYAEGLGRNLEVLDAQALWLSTEASYRDASVDLQAARAELLHAMGELAPPLPAAAESELP